MSEMAMVFFTSTTTPLYSPAWTPSTTGQYAGTCLFLIILSTVFRALLALKHWAEAALWSVPPARRGSALLAASDAGVGEGDEEKFAAAKGGADASSRAVAQRSRGYARAWRINVDGSRALLDVVIVGASYLL